MKKGHALFSWVLTGALCGLAAAPARAEEPAPAVPAWEQALQDIAAHGYRDIDDAKKVCPPALRYWAQELDAAGSALQAEAVRGVAATLESASVTTSDAMKVKLAPAKVLPPLLEARVRCPNIALTAAMDVYRQGHPAECDKIARGSGILAQAFEHELTIVGFDLDATAKDLMLRRNRLIWELAGVTQRRCAAQTMDQAQVLDDQSMGLREQVRRLDEMIASHAQGSPEL